MIAPMHPNTPNLEGVSLLSINSPKPTRVLPVPASTQRCWGGYSHSNGTPQLLKMLPTALQERFIVHDMSCASGRKMLLRDALYHNELLEEIQECVFDPFMADALTDDPSMNQTLQGVHALRTWLIPEAEMQTVQDVIDAALKQGVDFEGSRVPLEEHFPGASVYTPDITLK